MQVNSYLNALNDYINAQGLSRASFARLEAVNEAQRKAEFENPQLRDKLVDLSKSALAKIATQLTNTNNQTLIGQFKFQRDLISKVMQESQDKVSKQGQLIVRPSQQQLVPVESEKKPAVQPKAQPAVQQTWEEQQFVAQQTFIRDQFIAQQTFMRDQFIQQQTNLLNQHLGKR